MEDTPLSPTTQIDDASDALGHTLARLQRDEARQMRADALAPDTLRNEAQLGRFMPPNQNSYAAHLQLIDDASLKLGFSKSRQPTFDAHFTAPYPLLPVLRNALLCQLADSPNAPQRLASIARYLAAQPITPEGGKGAQALYKQLLKRQHTPLWLMPSAWLSAKRERPQQWGLIPLEQSPFSDAALQEMPPAPEKIIHAVASFELAEMENRDSKDPRAQKAQQAQDAAAQLNDIANDMASAGALTLSAQELHEPTRREAVELAKDILDKLRVALGGALIVNGLSQFDMNPITILGELKQVVKAFEFHLHKVAGLDAQIYENPAVAAANKAVGKLSMLAKKETLAAAQAQGDAQMTALVQADLAQLPSAWKPSETDTFASLFDDLESGLKTVIDRMNQLGGKDGSAEFWLGFSAEKSIGSADHGHKDTTSEKAMSDDSYYRQLNAQRALRARQAAVRYTQNQQQQRSRDTHDEAEHHPPKQQTAKPVSMNQLVGGDLINSMRSAMKTTANAAAVETGTKANIKNVVNQKEQANRAQRQRITNEQIRRANERGSKSHEAQEPIQPPPGKKKDHSHGL